MDGAVMAALGAAMVYGNSVAMGVLLVNICKLILLYVGITRTLCVLSKYAEFLWRIVVFLWRGFYFACKLIYMQNFTLTIR